MPSPRSQSTRISIVHTLHRPDCFQNRPELETILSWWRQGGGGVCSLVGIGGSGKTALVDRFLRLLPGVTLEARDLSKDHTLDPPDAVFVFSFSLGSPSEFIFELGAWLLEEGEASNVVPSTQEAMRRLSKLRRALVILDNLESAQASDVQEKDFGAIIDLSVRDLLVRVAEGFLPSVSVLATSRLELDDLAHRPHLLALQTDFLNARSCIDLIRDRGVPGTDDELLDIAKRCSFHALRIDLVSGFMFSFGSDLLPVPVFPSNANRQKRRRIEEQNEQLRQIADSYADVLSRSDPAALAILRLVSLFHTGVSAKDFVLMFTGAEKEVIAGSELAELTLLEVESRLDRLSSMRLVEAVDNRPGSPRVYTTHAAIREIFVEGLGSGAQMGYEIISSEFLSRETGQEVAIDSQQDSLDRYEEIIYCLLRSGFPIRAWEVYSRRLGGFEGFGLGLGHYSRGERICRGFLMDGLPSSIVEFRENMGGFVHNEIGLYLSALGKLATAAGYFRHSVADAKRRQEWPLASACLRNLAEAYLTAGHLRKAEEAADEAFELAGLAGDSVGQKRSDERRGFIKAMLGETREALGYLGAANESPASEMIPAATQISAQAGVWRADLFHRLKNNRRALRELESSGVLAGGEQVLAIRGLLLFADIAIDEMAFKSSRNVIEQVSEWIARSEAQELHCMVALQRARLALAKITSGPPEGENEHLGEVLRAISEGVKIAKRNGYGLLFIDFQSLCAKLNLHLQDTGAAHEAARRALYGEDSLGQVGGGDFGVEFVPGLMMGATGRECRYYWGEVEARHILGLVCLCAVAQKLGRAELPTIEWEASAPAARGLIIVGDLELRRASKMCRKSELPIRSAAVSARRQLRKKGKLVEMVRPAAPRSQARDVDETPTSKSIVVICYSSRDDIWLDRVRSHLMPVEEFIIWCDRDIQPGERWHERIQSSLKSAIAAVLLVSEHFLGSEYIRDHEMPTLLAAHSRDGLPIIPVFVRSCVARAKKYRYVDAGGIRRDMTLTELQGMNKPDAPLSELTPPDQDRIFVKLAEKLCRLMPGRGGASASYASSAKPG